MTKKIAQIALTLTVYLSIAVAAGSCIALLTPFFFVTIEMRPVKIPEIRYERTAGPFIMCTEKRGFPIVWYAEEYLLGYSAYLHKSNVLVNNLLWDIAFHTFVALGIMGTLVIESKKSKLRVYDLITP